VKKGEEKRRKDEKREEKLCICVCVSMCKPVSVSMCECLCVSMCEYVSMCMYVCIWVCVKRMRLDEDGSDLGVILPTMESTFAAANLQNINWVGVDGKTVDTATYPFLTSTIMQKLLTSELGAMASHINVW